MKEFLHFLRRSAWIQTVILAAMLPGLIFLSPVAQANPNGGAVIHGNVEIGESLNGRLDINQLSNKAIVNWDDFSIAAGEMTRINQPGAQAAILNRVTGGNPSALHGALQANGKVFVINPNGIVVGPTGTIDVGGLVLSTLDVSNADFLAGGDMIFRGNSGNGVKNMGRINAIGGDVFLVGQTVENIGTIRANGTVGLAGGSEVLITANPDANGERVFVRPSGRGSQVANSGTIEGASVELKAHGNAFALAINNSGSIRATGASRANGGVFLRAPGGRVDNTGSIRASLPNSNGGRILIEGAIVNAGGTIDASGVGNGRGGTIDLLGEEINVPNEATVKADGSTGGTVTIGDASTRTVNVAAGSSVSANGTDGAGGTISITGGLQSTLTVGGNVSASGINGQGGSILVNGTDIAVQDTAALTADGFEGGTVDLAATNSNVVGGSVAANGAKGGRVNITGDVVELTANAAVDVSGTDIGGIARIGGGYQGQESAFRNSSATTVRGGAIIKADGTGRRGAAGTAIVWSDGDTLFQGDIQARGDGMARGGFAEVSGKRNLVFEGMADLGGGTLLLDPDDFDLDTLAEETAVENTLNAGTDVIIFTDPADTGTGGTGNGHISILREIVTGTAAGNNGSLSLLAAGNLHIVRDIQLRSSGGGDVNLVAGWDGSTGFTPPGTGIDNPAGGVVEIPAPHGDAGAPAIDMAADFFDQPATYGNGNGAIFIGQNAAGGTAIDAVSVGSMAGQTNAVGYGLTLDGGAANNRRAQLGFSGAATGDIRVQTKAGGIDLNAGGGQRSFAKVGHGTTRSVQVAGSGDILLETTGAVTIDGGTNLDSYGQVGHGGILNNQAQGLAGDVIQVIAGTGVTLTGAAGDNGYAIIGNGGLASNSPALQQADITVTTTTGNITLTGSPSNSVDDAPAQIGNTGIGGSASTQGDITVTASAGDVILNAGGSGNGTPGYAQIGNGGAEASGSHGAAGDLTQVNAVNVQVNGSTIANGTEGYAQIGNGGHASNSALAGSVRVNATGAVTLQGGSAVEAYAQIGHGGDNSGAATVAAGSDISVGAGTVLQLNGGSNTFTSAQIGHGGVNSQNMVIGASNIDINLAAGAGSGDIILNASGSNAYSQIGHGGARNDGNPNFGDFTGDITIHRAANVTLTSGAAVDAYTIIGHGGEGGAGTGTAGAYTGDVSVMTAGSVALNGGTSSDTFSQIGHGGETTRATLAGTVTVDAGNNVNLTGGTAGTDGYSQIGHGGAGTLGDVTAGSTITVDAMNAIALQTGNDQNYAQIGHGGFNTMTVNVGTSNILVNTGAGSGTGDLTLTANDVNAYSQIGHGGSRTDGNANFGALGGDITIGAAANLAMTSAATAASTDGYTQIGHGGEGGSGAGAVGTYSGDISVTTAGNATLAAGVAQDAYSQIGHGGDNSQAATSGDLTLNAGGILDMNAGTGEDAYVQVGHGGHANDQNHGAATDLLMVTADSVELTGGTTAARTYAQIGMGGFDAEGTLAGDVEMNATGMVTVEGGAATNAYAQIGNGGATAGGAKSGTTTVSGSDVSLISGGGNQTYAQIGAGGGWDGSSGAGGAITSATTVNASGNVLLDASGGGINAYTQIGAGGLIGSNPGFDDIAGLPTLGNISVSVTAGGAVTLNGGDTNVNAYSQIGNGGLGWDGAKTNSGVAVSGSAIALNGGDQSAGYAQIGSGGGITNGNNLADGDVTGDVSVEATAGSVVAMGGLGRGAYVQIGNGGAGNNGTFVNTGNLEGDVDIASTGDISLTAGDGQNAYGHFGHGGNDYSGTKMGDVSVISSGGAITFQGAAGGEAGYAQAGHGGANASEDASGDITVDANGPGGNVDVLGGSGGVGSYAHIGHGGGDEDPADADGDRSGTIRVGSASGDVNVTGGTGTAAYAQIGSGGVQNDGNQSGDIFVTADTGNVSVTGTTEALGVSYGMIGHGDGIPASIGNREGGINVDAGGAITTTEGSDGTPAGIGHVTALGTTTNSTAFLTAASVTFNSDMSEFIDDTTDGGQYTVLTDTGNIDFNGNAIYDSINDLNLIAQADINVTALVQNSGIGGVHATAGIGAGGVTVGGAANDRPAALGSANGPTNVSGDFVSIIGSDSTDEGFAQIGYNQPEGGGADTSGNIMVDARDGAVLLQGGDAEGAFVQAGHGGAVANGTKDGDVTVMGASVTLNSGGIDSYTQIGNGGFNSTGDATSDTTVTATTGGIALNAGGAENAYALIGLGGGASSGNFDGDIDVSSATTVDVIGGGTVGDGITGESNFAMIGHSLDGGIAPVQGLFFVDALDFNNRDARWIAVPSEGPGTPANQYNNALNGDYMQHANGSGGTGPLTGAFVEYQLNVTVPGTYRLFPRWTGYDGGSDSIFFDVIELKDGTGNTIADWYEFTQGGNSDFNNPAWSTGGGFEQNQAGVSGAQPATWTIGTAGTFTVRATSREDGVGLDAFVFQLDNLPTPTGNGPATTAISGGVGSAQGDINVTAMGDINVEGGINDDSYGAIGHGGTELAGDAEFGTAADGADITVRSTAGSVNLTGGQFDGDAGEANRRYSVIGHHGVTSDFTAHGNVLVEADGDVALMGGIYSENHAQVGHSTDGPNGNLGPVLNGDVTVNAGGGIELQGGAAGGGGEGSRAMIGSGGSTRIVDITGDVSLTAGTPGIIAAGGAGENAFAQAGSGGFGVRGDITGSTILNTPGAVQFSGGDGLSAFAKAGPGGRNVFGDLGDEVSITGSTIDFLGGDGQGSFAHAGAGGLASTGAKDSDVTLTSTTGSITFEGGGGNLAYAQVGNGGPQSGGGARGNVILDSPQDITFRAGTGDLSYAMGGHGGVFGGGMIGDPNTTIEATAANDFILEAGASDFSFAHFGTGGTNFGGSQQAEVKVIAGNDVTLSSGDGNLAYAQVGGGGGSANGAQNVETFIHAGNDLFLTRGAGENAYAKIGNGDQLFDFDPGFGGTGDRSGDIQVTAGRTVNVIGGMVGHVDPAVVSGAGGGTPGTGDTFVAASRDAVESDRLTPIPTGQGSIIGDANSVFTAAEELRFYAPTRGNVQLTGAMLNGTAFVGMPAEGSAQRADEWAVVALEDGGPAVVLNEHANLADPVGFNDRWLNNYNTGIASEDTANFNALVAANFYLDAIVVPDSDNAGNPGGVIPPPQPPNPNPPNPNPPNPQPPTPPTPGGGLPEPVIPPGFDAVFGPDGDIIPFDNETGLDPVEIIEGPNGEPIAIFGMFLDDEGLFLERFGVVGFSPGRLAPGSPFVPAQPFIVNLQDDYFNWDMQRDFLTGERIQGLGTEGYEIDYDPSSLPGMSSFDVWSGGTFNFEDLIVAPEAPTTVNPAEPQSPAEIELEAAGDDEAGL